MCHEVHITFSGALECNKLQPRCSAGNHHPWQHVTETTAKTHAHVPFCARPSANRQPSSNKVCSLYHLLYGAVSDTKLHYNFPNHLPLVFCRGCINFLLIVTLCSHSLLSLCNFVDILIFTLPQLHLFSIYSTSCFGLTGHHQVYKMLD
jgi:hypothetical protein